MRPTTRESAILDAKINCLANLPIDVIETKDSDWLIRDKSGRCACGETNAVELTYFAADGEQYVSSVAYCENCGHE